MTKAYRLPRSFAALLQSNALAQRPLLLSVAYISALFVANVLIAMPALAIGVVSAHPVPVSITKNRVRPAYASSNHHSRRVEGGTRRAYAASASIRHSHGKKIAKHGKKDAAKIVIVHPQDYIAKMSSETLAPGVVHKTMRGALTINLLDIDLKNASVKVKPVLAGESFDCLRDVTDQSKECKALAAINANYFKKGGTPLGTLILDGEWIAGPLYDRVSMGITDTGSVLIDRVNLYGTLQCSNPDIPSLWVNNINQPRRHDCHLVAYTRRWGHFARLAYPGCLVAVNAQGEVIDTADMSMEIPYGGYVLTDSRDSDIAKLSRGDKVTLTWHTRPNEWQTVVQAVSGGPTLIKDGKLYVDLQDENFRHNWTDAHIQARTAGGITADNHLLLATIEGPHTLWDVAKFFYKLGAVDAMNLDGGGSTTMVVRGVTVTRNSKSHLRRVATSLAIVEVPNPTDTKPAILSNSTNSTVASKSQTSADMVVYPEPTKK